LYDVTTHEIGHTWFPMVVNTDERRHAWMDEGFNTFINTYSNEDWFHTKPSLRAAAMFGSVPTQVPIMTEADQLNMMMLGMLQYQKAGAGLQLLRENILGHERFDYAFRTYIRRWAFKSPQPTDFFRTMEDASGMDLDWFWRGWFVEAATLDQAIEQVRQGDEEQPARITFGNRGRMVMPLSYKVTFSDDSTEVRDVPVQAWFSSNRVQQRLDVAKPVRKIEIDAQRVMPDCDRGNNVWEHKD
jgi:aminopeptidase N